MPLIIYFICGLTIALTGCSGSDGQVGKTADRQVASVHQVYMPTGFYFLDATGEGIQMVHEKSAKAYNVAPKPFASVQNIESVELKQVKMEDRTLVQLCLIFDAKGTEDLSQGTQNSKQPKVAIVIGGKLLYVVDNYSPLKTGIVDVDVTDYSKKEVLDMKQAVEQKR